MTADQFNRCLAREVWHAENFNTPESFVDDLMQVYFSGIGRLKNVKAAVRRGRHLRCTHCNQPGATIGCRVDRCPQNYHLVRRLVLLWISKFISFFSM